MSESAKHSVDRRRLAWGVLVVTLVAACVIAWSDRRFYLGAGYGTEIRPSYWGHGFLMAFYAGSAFALARAAVWKTAAIVLAGVSFGVWSMFVVDAALDASALPAPLSTIAGGVDSFAGRGGAGSLFLGIVVSGIAASGAFWALTGRARVGAVIAGVSLASGILAVYGWGEAAGKMGSQGLLMASSVVWHGAVAGVLLLG